MDIFKQKKFYLISLIILVLINIGTVTLLWIGKPQPPHSTIDGKRDGRDNQEQIATLLKNEIAFSDDQIAQYLDIRERNMTRIRQLDNQIHRTKRELFDNVLVDGSENIDLSPILDHLSELQNEKEILTYQHLLGLKNLCNEEQKDKLKSLMDKIIPRQDKNPPPPHRSDRPGQNPPPPPPPLRRGK